MNQPTAEPSGAAHRFPCHTCGAEMRYDAATQGMLCGHCGAATQVGTEGQRAIVEHDLEGGLAGAGETGFGAQVRIVECNECGARVTFAERLTSTRCEFCGSAHVLEQEANRALIRPESLVPFKVDSVSAKQRFSGWLGGLWFRPSDLKHRARIGDIAGVYVPYWTFDSRTDSRWTAEAGHHYYETESYTDSAGKKQTRQAQKTRWEPAWGTRTDRYDDVLICASKGLPDGLSDRLKTFDTTQLVQYAPDYLSGWRAEEYGVGLNEAWQRGVQHMEAGQRSRCSGDVPGDTQRALNVETRFSEETFKHVLLPIFIASYRYHGEVHRFLVNGQTGEVSGKAPYSWVKIALFVMAILMVIAVCGGALALFGD